AGVGRFELRFDVGVTADRAADVNGGGDVAGVARHRYDQAHEQYETGNGHDRPGQGAGGLLAPGGTSECGGEDRGADGRGETQEERVGEQVGVPRLVRVRVVPPVLAGQAERGDAEARRDREPQAVLGAEHKADDLDGDRRRE